jgi:predicted Fe-Mo cluster-binding NifX family protein
MKLCVSSTGSTLDSKVDARFGRSAYLQFVDTDTLRSEAEPNTAMNAGQGAGIAAAQLVADQGAEGVLTGVVGPKAFAALRVAGIRVYEGASPADTVRDAVAKFAAGAFEEVAGPSGGAGWGGGTGPGAGGGRRRRGRP